MEQLNLPHNIKKAVDGFMAGLKDIYADKLISAVLYGSAASGEYSGGHSNINLAVVLVDTSIPSISRASGLVNKNKFLNINPIFFTEDHIKKSLDVFPIEFLDIKENHVVLYGKDIFKDIQVDIRNLKFQCEQELKSKILSIKKIYLRTKNRYLLKNFLFKSLTSSLHIIRNIIRLKGRVPPYKKEDIIDQIHKEFAIDTSGLKKILDAKNKNMRLGPKDMEGFFTLLVKTLEDISDKVDSL